MVGARRGQDGEDAVGRRDGVRLGELGAALSVRLDGAGVGGVRDGDLVGAEADGGPVARVEGLEDKGRLAAELDEGPGEAGELPEQRTGKFSEGGEEEVVDDGVERGRRL